MRLSVRLWPRSPPQRCDRALVDALQQAGHACTRSQLARAFESGGVTAGGRRLKPSIRVEGPLEVEVVLPRPEPLRAEPEPLPLAVLHEDEDLLVVDKPAGMVVHAGPGHRAGTLVNAVLHHLGVGPDGLPVLPGNDPSRPGIVHRLDRDTSGVLVVAKNVAAQEALAAQFRVHALHRRYVSVVEGLPSWDERRVETGHARDPADRRRFAPIEGARRRARSDVTVQQRLVGAAVLAWTLHTGRTHQIRMHARHLGLPILGDRLYGRTPRAAKLREAVQGLTRQALHAEQLELRHPRDDRLVRWSASLPPELVALVRRLSEPG